MSETRKVGRPPLSPEERERRAKEKEPKKKIADLARKNANYAAGQDIGEIPPCKDPERRKFALESQKNFNETYLKSVFNMGWSADHLRIMPKSDVIVSAGGKQAIAMPRGSGKSTLCFSIVMRASLGGFHPYAIYVGAVAAKSEEAMTFFKTQLLTNPILLEDFPEACFPIRQMGGETRKCMGQHCGGLKTNIKWGTDMIRFPNIKESPLSGFTIGTGSMDSAIRGGLISLPDGRIARPSLAVVDDPQTNESALSQGPASQTEKRLNTITRTIQGLAGPNSRISMFIPCTVIERGDLADQILDRRKYPDFHGERTKRLYSWPADTKDWDRYREIREDCQRADLPPTESTNYYGARRCPVGRRLDDPNPCSMANAGCMDCGAVVDWPERLDNKPEMPEEYRNISSLQAAMHSFYEYKAAGFASEFQNEPLRNEIDARMPTIDEVISKANGMRRGIVPQRSIHTVAFIDPGEYFHFYEACSFEKNFTGSLIDYGTWPDQGRIFSKQKINTRLAEKYPGAGPKGALLAGLIHLMEQLKAQQYSQDGGRVQHIELCLIDTGHFPDEVHAAITKVGDPRFRPSRGQGITAGKKQFNDYDRERFRESGNHWWIPKDQPKPTIQIDTNYWKTHAFSCITTAQGDPGSLTHYGSQEDARMMASHFLAEYYSLPSSEKGITVQEWHWHVGRDNEGLDGLVGCMVAASKLGCSIIPSPPSKKKTQRIFDSVSSGTSSNPEWS